MPNPNDPAIDALIFEVFRLNGALAVAGDALTASLGLTSARWQVMGSIARSDGATVAELARRIGVTRQSVQRVVTELVSEGYVALVDNPKHKRAKIAVLTGQGQHSLDAIAAAWTPIAEDLGNRFGHDRLMGAAQLLAALRDEFRGFASEAAPRLNSSPGTNNASGTDRKEDK